MSIACLFRLNLAAVFITSVFSLLSVQAETIPLTDGSSMTGRIVSVAGDQVLVRRGFVDRKISKDRIARPDTDSLPKARASFGNKDYQAACNLCRQILLFEPKNADAASLWRNAHECQIRDWLVHFPRDRFYGEGMLPLVENATTNDLPIIHEILETLPRERNRVASAKLLAWLKSETSIEPLSRALNNWSEAEARAEAAYALGEIGSNKASIALQAALANDPDQAVRRRAAEALNKLPSLAILALRKVAQSDKHRHVRSELSYLLDIPGYKRTNRPSLRPGRISVGYLDGTCYLVYVPSQYKPRQKTHLLISVHGTDGFAYEYEKICHVDAERYNLILLAPQFDYGQYPHFGRLNVGLRANRPDLKLLEIVDELSKRLNFDKDKLLVFGHSQGGQFIHRLVAAHPNRIWRAAACAVSNFAMPDTVNPFPFGMGQSDWTPDLVNLDFAKTVKVPMAVICGTKDEKFRIDASKAFVEAGAKAYSEKHSLPCKFVFIPVPDGPHAGVSNYPTAREFLFAELPPPSP